MLLLDGYAPCRLRRFSVILLAVFQFWLLNIFIPGHTRGRITIGPREAGDGCRACGCPMQHPGRPSPADRRNCAVCYFAAHIATPPAPLAPPELSRAAHERPLVLPTARLEHRFALTVHGRDPPAIG